jgi:hypothetical protein
MLEELSGALYNRKINKVIREENVMKRNQAESSANRKAYRKSKLKRLRNK